MYTHTTRATGTVLTAAIYNGDHQNHITNQNPLMTGAYSDNVAQMQAVTDPGTVGVESLAGSLGGELERLRFVIKQMNAGAQWYPALLNTQGANVASAATLNLDTTTGDYVHITGTTNVTAITLSQGRRKSVVFDGILTLTNGASLILPGGANIVTAAGDFAVFRGEAAGVVRCVQYSRAALVPGTTSPSFESAEVAIGAGGTTTTAAHGLGVVPRQSWVVLRNKTAEFGYSVGDEASIGNGNSFTVYVDATNIGIVSATGNVPAVVRRDTFGFTTITSANWKYVMRANK